MLRGRFVSLFLLSALLSLQCLASRVVQSENFLVRGDTFWYHEADGAMKEFLFRDLGCYCKQVESLSDCPEHKQLPDAAVDETVPSYYRFFHADKVSGDKKPHMCCKLSYTSIFDIKGFKYKRQDIDLCTHDVRPVPDDVCCRVHFPGEEAIGLRLRQVLRRAGQYIDYDEETRVIKSREFTLDRLSFHLEDIADSLDYNGTVVSAAAAREFVTANRQEIYGGPESELYCMSRRGLKEVLEDKAECTLRSHVAQECCCHEADLEEAERCLPLPASSRLMAGPVEMNGIYRESISVHKSADSGDLKTGEISWASPEYRLGKVPYRVQSVDPEVPAGPEAMTFDWESMSQWTWECVNKKKVPYIASRWEQVEASLLEFPRHAQRTVQRNQQRARQRRQRQQRQRREKRRRAELARQRAQHKNVAPRKQTYKRKVYYQDYEEQCITRKYTRLCPADRAMYRKIIRGGRCTQEPTDSNHDVVKLVDIGGMRFRCPKHYKTSKSIREGYDYDQRCRCTSRRC